MKFRRQRLNSGPKADLDLILSFLYASFLFCALNCISPQAWADEVPRLFCSRLELRLRIERPGHGKAHNDRLDQARQLDRRSVGPYLAPLLRERNNLSENFATDAHSLLKLRPYRRTRRVRGVDRPQHCRILVGLAG